MAACHNDDPDPSQPQQHFGRTVLVYMAMQNSLGYSNYHKGDSAEIANAMSYIPKDDRLLLFIDDAKKPRIYELNNTLSATDPKTGKPYGPKLVKQWANEASSATPAVLSEVLEYMRLNYASDSYGLVMGSHANGWLPVELYPTGNSRRRKTFGIDVGPDGSMRDDMGVAHSTPDQITIDDLASSIGKSSTKLDFIMFDACLMQNIEVAYALRNAAKYIIASPISISGQGAYYTDLVHYGFFSSNPTDVATTYVNYYLGNGSVPTDSESKDYGTVISCIDTKGLEHLADIISDIITELSGASDPAAKVEALKQKDMSAALNYHTYSRTYVYRPHYYDLVSAIQTLGADAMQMKALRQALSDVVTYQGATQRFWIGPSIFAYKAMPTSLDDWCGISMFVPQQFYSYNAVNCVFGDLNEAYKDTEWYKKVY